MFALVVLSLSVDDTKKSALPIQPSTISHANAEVSIVRIYPFERMLTSNPGKPPQPMACLSIKVRIRNKSADMSLNYRGWGVKNGRPDETTASAQTDIGPLMLRLSGGNGRARKIPPRSQIDDELFFVAPPDDSRYFYLTLPGDGLDLDKPFTFTIRREAWADPPKYDPNTVTGLELLSFRTTGDGVQAHVILFPSKKTMDVKAGQKIGKWKILAIDPAAAAIVVARPDGSKETIRVER
jgi:hypothetical protein